MTHPLRFGVLYDFRNPQIGGIPTPEFYARTLDQIREVDRLGFDHVWLSEHHFVEDGYLPALLAMSGAIAAITKRVAISQDILLVPFQHPLRLAEDLAVLDNVSGGRMMLGAGMGYVPSEFETLGVVRRNRVSLLEEALQICHLAWTQEQFSFSGRRFQFRDVRVRPRPVQAGGPPIWLASMSEPAARRAARFGTHLLPQGDRGAALDPWVAALDAQDRRPSDFRVGLVRNFKVADDPERARAAFRASAAAEAEREVGRTYSRWFEEAGDQIAASFRAGDAGGGVLPQDIFFGTPDQCAAEVERMARTYHITDFILRGVSPGQPPEESVPLLERFAREVIPRFRADSG